MAFTAQGGTVDSMPGNIVLGLWDYVLTPPDVQPVYQPVWLVELVSED